MTLSQLKEIERKMKEELQREMKKDLSHEIRMIEKCIRLVKTRIEESSTEMEKLFLQGRLSGLTQALDLLKY